jgi:methyl-accepting chemotaxis protein
VLARVVRDATEAPPSVRHRIDRANTLLGQLGTTRAGADDLVVTAAQAIAFYSSVNVELLAALDAFVVTGVSGPRRSGALACVALLYAKEKAGVERAQLTDAFLQDRFSEGQRLSVAALIAAQASYLHIFSAAAPRAADQLLRRTLASPEASEVQRMESVVYGDEDAGFGIDASTWFAMITRKIDMLGDVSDTVIKMLKEQS